MRGPTHMRREEGGRAGERAGGLVIGWVGGWVARKRPPEMEDACVAGGQGAQGGRAAGVRKGVWAGEGC